MTSDYAAMIKAALALHEAAGERSYLEKAIAWQSAFDRHYFNAETGGYYMTADDAEALVVRPASTSDDAIPNPSAIAAHNLVRLAMLSGDESYRARADALIEGVIAGGADNLFAHVATLNAIDLRLHGAEIVVTGPDAERFAKAALKLPFINRAVLRAASAAALPPSHPAQDKIKAVPGSAAFVCVGETCSLPITNLEALTAAMLGSSGANASAEAR
jgi:uncharacterized protein YyaL (SSP411 family)